MTENQTQNHLLSTLNALADIRRASRLKTRRNFADFLADRIVQASTEPTLLGLLNRLYSLVDADPVFGSEHVSSIVRANACDDAHRILAWIRKNPKIVSMLAMLKPEERAEIAPSIILDAEPDGTGVVAARSPFDIGIEADLQAPLAHGADQKAGNATLFRRQQVVAANGAMLELPFYAGNALRGLMRDLLADHFLISLGFTARRDRPPVAIWFFHALYAGGSLEEDSRATKALAESLGKTAGSISGAGVRQLRDMIPPLSLLGCALGNRVLPGRIQVADLRPRCIEWGTGETTASELMTWQYLTRRDDHEGRSAEDKHAGMIASTECLRAGTVLDGGIDADSHIQDVERSCLALGLKLLQEAQYIGAESRRGFGRSVWRIENMGDPAPYEKYLAENRKEILTYLTGIGALDADAITIGEDEIPRVTPTDDDIPY